MNKYFRNCFLLNPFWLLAKCSFDVITAAVIAGIAGLGAAGVSANASSKASKAAAAAGTNSQVDIAALDAMTRQIAQRNAYESAELERQLTPEVPQLRTDANNQILSQMNPSGWDQYGQGLLTGAAGNQVGPANTPLLRAAIEKARANLALGGRLSSETQNAVTRSGLARAGTIAQGGLGLGRDVVARDLGLTSLDLENSRLADASRIGGQELALSDSDTNTAFNNKSSLMNTVQLLQAIQSGQYGRALSAGQYGQSIRQPIVGLDPASAGNISVGNANSAGAAASNQANIYGAQSQNYMNLAGQLGGYSLLRYNQTGRSPYTGNPTDTGLPYV